MIVWMAEFQSSRCNGETRINHEDIFFDTRPWRILRIDVALRTHNSCETWIDLL